MTSGSATPDQDGPPPAPAGGVLILKSVLRIAVAALFGATLFLMIFEKQLIYYPSASVDLSPRALGLPFEEVTIDVEPGVKVHGWFLPAAKQPATATILFSHGNAGNIADRLDRVASWRDLGADFFLYDYRGFGKSTGSPDEEGTYRDGRAVYDYLVSRRGVDPSRLVLMGESLGCAVSVQLALDRRAAGLVLEAPFASIAHMASAIYPFLPARFLVRTRYDNLGKVPQLKMPLLLTQGTQDEVIPVAQGQQVFAAAPEPKRLFVIEGAHHNDVYVVGASAYLAELKAFLDRVLPPTLSGATSTPVGTPGGNEREAGSVPPSRKSGR